MSKIQYQNYQSTRDLAWEILIQNNVCELPVKISSICRNMGIKLKSYEQSKVFMKIPIMREEYIKNAIAEIDRQVGKITKLSSLYETEPWGFNSENKFINVAVEVKTELSITNSCAQCVSKAIL